MSSTWAHEIDDNQGTYQDNYGFYAINSFSATWNAHFKEDKGTAGTAPSHDYQLPGIVRLASGRPVTASIQISDSTPFPGAAFTITLNGSAATTARLSGLWRTCTRRPRVAAICA